MKPEGEANPVRSKLLPYGRQWIDEEDVRSVIDILQGDWLTTGPTVELFEQAFCAFTGSKYAVAVSNGTAALHCAMHSAGIQPGDEVIVPAITFAATANAVLYCGGTPVFADVDPDTLLIDPQDVVRKITPRTKMIAAVDYAGQPCDYDQLRRIADQYNLILLDDACHAVGGSYKDRSVGTLADLNTFSFHPVKNITTGEGGMITNDNPEYASKMRIFRNHGITSDHRQRSEKGSFFYEMVELGMNYRLTDFQCALGITQLKKLPEWNQRRREIAALYDKAFSDQPAVTPLKCHPDVVHAYHLYTIKLNLDRLTVDRNTIFNALRNEGIGVNVHYIPVYFHPYYQQLGYGKGLCPVAESAWERLLTLPLFPQMTDGDVSDVITAIKKVSERYAR